MPDDTSEPLFSVVTPLGFLVRTTLAYWTIITTIKHPVMANREEDVQKTLRSPAEVRQSSSDRAVYLFYIKEREGRWLCAVVKRLDGEGFLITAYPTDTVKEGVKLWPT